MEMTLTDIEDCLRIRARQDRGDKRPDVMHQEFKHWLAQHELIPTENERLEKLYLSLVKR